MLIAFPINHIKLTAKNHSKKKKRKQINFQG